MNFILNFKSNDQLRQIITINQKLQEISRMAVYLDSRAGMNAWFNQPKDYVGQLTFGAIEEAVRHNTMSEMRKGQVRHSYEYVSQGNTDNSNYKNIIFTPRDDQVIVDILVSEVKSGAIDGTMTVRLGHCASTLNNAHPDQMERIRELVDLEIDNVCQIFEAEVRDELKRHASMMLPLFIK